ncbi:hypothetical protein SASPL_116411 [Salvia splendens]|uniref:Uncharacterized protein n=1 Tax=Salvia splendens TaxID=180675 RepID=A0A8X8XVL5_SALSN|nr:uncharacterized protein LOC121809400 [Salvia splendens]KAG6419899.1 hypothetical protein SASPL_116411 [Salvia splendens]
MSHIGIAPITPHAPKSSISTRFYACNAALPHQKTSVQRRDVAMGLAGVLLGLSVGGGNAWGAARRPPPPPPEEKKDPNVTGLAAKVLASKKRKEAMKETIAKLRDKGKVIQETSPSQ